MAAVLLRRRRGEVRPGRRDLAAGPRRRRHERVGSPVSTTEVESALVSHPLVAEAAVVGATDE